MRMLRNGVLSICVVLVSACATASGGMGSAILRPATDTPQRFARVGETAEPVAEGLCWSPLEDRRDGTRMVMQRAAGGMADYAVPMGRYGVTEKELLRVRCSTGEPLGVVPR